MSATTPYPNLLAPIELPGTGVTLPNRVIMGSMHIGLEEEPDGFERLAAFYRERAAGGASLIVTGGVSPNREGRLTDGAATLASEEDAAPHRAVTDAVHDAGGRIALQLLHAGRYGAHPEIVAPSEVQAPISRFAPRAMSASDIERTIDDFARAAQLARSAGYDGVEIMGSEGYLINQFTAAETNHRTDEWGGDWAGRSRLPVEIVRRVREAVGPECIIIYRLSALDLVPGGSSIDEVLDLAARIEAAGATLVNTGIGWHEARIPTIAASVPRGAFVWATRALRSAVSIPLIATNRINTPEVAERILASGDADLVSLARPFLADPEFVSKSAAGAAHRINTCIACNQACLDHTFSGRTASCLVNPRAGRETELVIAPTTAPRRIAVIGAGPAGLACAVTAAERGHSAVLFDAADRIGGQLNLALTVPGKREFTETIRYFGVRLAETGVELRLGTTATAEVLALEGYDEVVVATGVRPRIPDIPGIEHPSVLSYLEVLGNGAAVGRRVAILGAGGIGFDTAEFLLEENPPDSATDDPEATREFFAHWGVDPAYATRGGLAVAARPVSAREVVLLQRSAGKPGAGLGKTTGWIHRTELTRRGVEMLAGVSYEHIDDAGLHVSIDGVRRLIEADTIVVCTGQETRRELAEALDQLGISAHVIGGAATAGALDAKRAIEEGTRLAARL